MADKIKCDCGITFRPEEGQISCNYCGIKLLDIGKGKVASSSSDYNDADYIKVNSDLIEKILEASGIFVRVKKIDILEDFYVFYLDIGVGTNLDKLEKQDRSLALALASPTGKVEWQIPIPGESLVGLKVPKPSKEYFERIKFEEEWQRNNNSLRSKIAIIFFLIGEVNYYIAHKIVGGNKPK